MAICATRADHVTNCRAGDLSTRARPSDYSLNATQQLTTGLVRLNLGQIWDWLTYDPADFGL
jgi:hypothetical protein